MIPLSLGDLSAMVGGTLLAADPDTMITGSVEFDSRKVTPGGLFVAFPGERVDGHDYAARASAAGAAAVMGTRAVPGVPMVLVADAQIAMGRLARAVLDQLPKLKVIALTGSSGKTTTKDLLAGLLGRVGPTVAPPGSFNNELGAPYTALRSDADTRFLIMEMGSRGPGHLRYLCDLTPPEIGVVINVGVAHLGEFGSVDAIAAAKAELPQSLPAGGVAVLNADDHRVVAMADSTPARVVLAGEDPSASVRAVDVTVDTMGRARFTLVTAAGSQPVRLAVAGRHQVGNSLLAAAVAIEAGLGLPEIAAALGELTLASPRRMEVIDRSDGITIIDDSYNANPASTAAALRALVAMGSGRRTIAVLGYLAELGEHEWDGHAEVGRLAARLGVDQLVVVGDQAGPIAEGARTESSWGGKSVQVTDQDEAIALLTGELRPGDVVLVKGSRYRTWDVADALRAGASNRRPEREAQA